ncbi:MAG: TonB-dependent receptor [Bacteroidota bacterium]
MSRYLLYGVFTQALFASMLLANDGNAQKKSIHDIYIDISSKNLKSAIKQIENSTQFVFTYNRAYTDVEKQVSINAGVKSLAEILTIMAKSTGYKFSRINNNIHITELENSEESSVIYEEITLQQLISGKVTSSDGGEALPGVSILIKGTNTGTTTDLDGNYTLAISEGEVLMFSFIGYKTQEIEVLNRTTIDVKMEVDLEQLEEVVVIGYGVQERKEITSAVASVSAEDFNQGNVNDVSQLLQGKVAGLSITRAGGDPNGDFNIRLRGTGTVGANTSPLIVIDGVIGADLNSVDPSDIATFDVLKDGSAAAIYGTRGSAGVILITTKTGKTGKSTIDYNGYVAAEQIARTVDVMDRGEFVGAGGNDLGDDTDWFDEISRTGMTHVHNLALSGGTANTTYRVSLNYRDVQGIALNTGFRQLNGRLNLTQRALDDKLALTFNIGSTVRESEFGDGAAFTAAAIYNPSSPIRRNPGDPLFEENDGFFELPINGYRNPVAILEQNVNEGNTKRLNFNTQVDYEIIDGLNAMMRYSRNQENVLNGRYLDRNSQGLGLDRNGLATRETQENYNDLFESTLNYTRTFDRLNVSVLGGYSYQKFTAEEFSAQGGDFRTDEFTYNNLGAANDFRTGEGTINSSKEDNTLVAFFGRVNLNLDDTYFFSASLRHEGSSQFGDNEKWGSFPAVSGGVNIAKLVSMPSVNNLKARASFGVTGALPPGPYLSLSRFERSGSFFFNGSFIDAFGTVQNANPNLRWEQKEEINLGLDFGLFDDRLTGSIDYFRRTTTDLILEAAVPSPPNPNPRTWLNVGEIQNNGIEMIVNYQAISKPEFSWTPFFNFSHVSNQLISLSTDDVANGIQDIADLGSPGQEGVPLIRVEEGGDIGNIWGLVYDGIDEDGMFRFQDRNGDGTVNEEDRAVIGQGLPDLEFGFGSSFTYKQFDFNFFFRGAVGHDLVNTYRAFYELPPAQGQNFNAVRTDFFLEDLSTDQSPVFSSYHVEDADFIRLDNMTIGYNLSLGENNPFSRVRFYASGQNLFYITGYTGVDPEIRDRDEDNILAPGIDRRNNWARTRTFTFGVNFSL